MHLLLPPQNKNKQKKKKPTPESSIKENYETI